MEDENTPIFVYTTFATGDDARQLGRKLVTAKLAACVNIFANMTAIYEWKGNLEETGEVAMLIKSRRGVQEQLLKEARKLHPYDTPSLVVLGVTGGDQDFFNWIAQQTRLDG